MASDAYLSSYDATNTKTVHINSAGGITAPMQYAIWDKNTRSATIIAPDSTTAESELRLLAAKRGSAKGLCVITVPV